jgi:hypothetical protein
MEVNNYDRYELETSVDWQDAPFIITAEYETVKAMHDERQREIERQQQARLRRTAARAVATAVEAPVHVVSDRLAAVKANVVESVQVRAYDFLNGTNFRRALAEQRQIRKDTAFAEKIGLLAVEPCAKHRKAMQMVRDIR